MRRLAAFAVAALLGGCASFGRGVTKALLERSRQPAADTRLCDVEGRPGVAPIVAERCSFRETDESLMR